jgi:hypothetical protein
VDGDAAFYPADEWILERLENHAHMVAPHFLHCNFARIHKTLRITPAMATGLSDHLWSYEELVGLLG